LTVAPSAKRHDGTQYLLGRHLERLPQSQPTAGNCIALPAGNFGRCPSTGHGIARWVFFAGSVGFRRRCR
jgi:hypothetical protein